MKKILCILLAALLTSCATTKSFPPTTTSTTPRSGFLNNQNINLLFFDSRVDKSFSNEIQTSIMQHLKESYPSANFNLSNDFFADPDSNKITIKITIAGYAAGFGVKSTSGIGMINGKLFYFAGVADGMWNGLTGIGVNLYDYRKGEKKQSTTLSQVITKPNMGGYSTAKNALRISFQSVMDQLCAFIDQTLMK